MVWEGAESSVGIMAASIPFLRPLARKLLEKTKMNPSRQSTSRDLGTSIGLGESGAGRQWSAQPERVRTVVSASRPDTWDDLPRLEEDCLNGGGKKIEIMRLDEITISRDQDPDHAGSRSRTESSCSLLATPWSAPLPKEL